VDGGSTDATLEIVRSFAPRFGERLRWVSEPDEGIYDAMNKGITMCAGEIISILNSDDRYPPTALKSVADAFRAHPGAGAVYGDAEVIDGDGGMVRYERASALSPGMPHPDWMPMCHQSLFVSRKTYEELGVYDTRYRVLADYDFVLRCLEAGVEFVQVSEALAQFRLGGACNSDDALLCAEAEKIRVAYGASPVKERVRRIRHAVSRAGYAVLGGGRRR
ncbi:MAG: glycosyltransferase family 2 protein, partial [Coriobacteriia bacterium]|nr:glycosyltransferase family 2 protein [Coriobacteriia bacterium]